MQLKPNHPLRHQLQNESTNRTSHDQKSNSILVKVNGVVQTKTDPKSQVVQVKSLKNLRTGECHHHIGEAVIIA